VIGYDDVGKGSAVFLRQEGMIVKIAEIDPICVMVARAYGFELVSSYIDGVNTGPGDIIVTTTGNTSVCDENMLKTIKNGAVVCNIGHFDNETDTTFMRENWKFEEVKL
jgi:adenosylhomocysteinase